jgi:DNA polymerase-3 subunit gamma/tau
MKPLKTVIENIDFYSKQIAGPTAGKAQEGKMFRKTVQTVQTVQTEAPDILPEKVREPEMQYTSEEPTEEKTEEKPEDTPEENTLEDSEDDETPEEVPSAATMLASGDLSSAWAKALDKIEAPLASKISQASVEFKDDGLLLTLDGGHAVFEDAIKKGLKSLENIVSAEYGNKVRIKLATSQKKAPRKKDLKEKAMSEPVVREALELFEGRVVDVTPIENTKNGGEHV